MHRSSFLSSSTVSSLLRPAYNGDQHYEIGGTIKNVNVTHLKFINILAGENWEIISRNLQDRTDQQCQQRWTKVVNPNLIKGK